MYEILFLLLSSLISLLRTIIFGGCGSPITSHAMLCQEDIVQTTPHLAHFGSLKV